MERPRALFALTTATTATPEWIIRVWATLRRQLSILNREFRLLSVSERGTLRDDISCHDHGSQGLKGRGQGVHVIHVGQSIAEGLATGMPNGRQSVGSPFRTISSLDPAEVDRLANDATKWSVVASEKIAVSKLGPMACIISGVVLAVGALGWAALVFAYDQMITPRGQVMMSFTTAGVMLVFIGSLAYWRRGDRERKLRADAVHAMEWAKSEEARLERQAAFLGVIEDIRKEVDALASECSLLRLELSTGFAELGRVWRPQPNSPARSPRKGRRQPRQRPPDEKPVTQSFTEYLAARDDMRREQGGEP